VDAAVEITEVSTVEEALDVHSCNRHDVVVVGRPSTPATSAEIVRRLRERAPELAVTIVVDPRDPRAVADAVHAGATGVISDGLDPDHFATLVHAAASGTRVVDGRAAGSLASAWLPGSQEPLSTREFEVLERLASGGTNAAIAAELYVSRETVKSHVARLLRKLGARDRGAAVDKARRLGLLGDDDQSGSDVAIA
ncbi:MAG: LuxR C-terminal-related transcriptional regulator, partial [Ilumatobacteraceae bacterium]